MISAFVTFIKEKKLIFVYRLVPRAVQIIMYWIENTNRHMLKSLYKLDAQF